MSNSDERWQQRLDNFGTALGQLTSACERERYDDLDDPASASSSEWPVVNLEEVSSDEPASIAVGPFGSRMKSDVYTPSGVPVIRGTNISRDRAWRNDWVYVSDDFADGLPNCNVREGD